MTSIFSELFSDRTLIIIIRVTKFLDSLVCLDKDDVDNENKNYL